MGMSQTQKKLRQWFRNRKWHAGGDYNGFGVWAETPVQKGISTVVCYRNGVYLPKEEQEEYHDEYYATLDYDPSLSSDRVGISLYKRKAYTSWPHSETKTETWSRQPAAYLTVKIGELEHFIEMAQDAKKTYEEVMARCHKSKGDDDVPDCDPADFIDPTDIRAYEA